jgi:predicted transport protein
MVLYQMTIGVVEEDQEQEVVDRSYWEKMANRSTVQKADKLLESIHAFDPSLDLKYNKFYVGLAKDGNPNNFAIFKPQKNILRLEVRMKRYEETAKQISDKGLDLMDYSKWGRYRIRLSKADIKENLDFISELLKMAFTETTG